MSTRLLARHQPPLCPDAIEANGDLVLLASYQLEKESGRKSGELALLRVVCDDGARSPAWRQEATVSCGAVFDAKWEPGSGTAATRPSRLLSSEAGDARVKLWALSRPDDEPSALRLLAACELAPGEPNVSALFLDFLAPHGAPGSDGLLVSRSDGQVSSCATTPTGVCETGSWAAHTLHGSPIEVWTVAVNRQADGHAAWSGGDDGLLKGWDTRTCGAGARPTFVSTAHGAGVTHVAWHPHEPHVAATGSYDEQVRLWDDRATGRGPLSARAAGGGVWRLRWHPHASHRGLLAAACMYGGAQILVCEALQDTGAAAAADAHVDDARLLGGCRQLAHHTAHESIAYAVEWLGGPALPEAPAGCWRPSCDAIATDGPGTGDEGDGRPPRSGFALASCSFYDRSLHLWEPAASIDAA